jgi:hypothetical protein
MEYVMLAKSKVNTYRKLLAHPIISPVDLEIFLQRLHVGDGTSKLELAIETEMLNHLRTTSISEDNVRRAARRIGEE